MNDTRLESSDQPLRRLLRPAIMLTLALCVLTGLVYPGVVTLLAQVLFPRQADGSLISRDGQVVGSALIGQQFAAPGYFHSRPSGAGQGYDATASAGTNKGPTDLKLADTLIAGAVARAMEEDGVERGKVPSDMATASGSGLDPHISPANAAGQVTRVAKARGLPEADVQALVARHTEGRQFGILGDPRVNVLLLNLALDSLKPAAAR
ncbi:MAG TPA: potassium-transporting ATPase subunit KdpC [Gemmatimonadales bacterium]|nr:potassium-transporting ATPase subunit KdpC [Gemmatimonadales bacterium]